MPEIALGTAVFKRTEKLEKLLESLPSFIDTVYVADDGHTEERQHLYDREYEFSLELLDLNYDAGLGTKRRRITEASDEPFLFIVDSDHQVPANADILVEQLREMPSLGGICGVFGEYGAIRAGSHNLYEEGNYLVRDIRESATPITAAGQTLYTFDSIPNAAVFRTECLEDYTWDSEYVIGGEHVDFYVGHLRQTEWKFAINPRVIFEHEPGGSDDYILHRSSDTRLAASEEYFLEKWGYDGIVNIQNRWLNSYDPSRETTQVIRPILGFALRRLPPSTGSRIVNGINRFTRYNL